MTWGHLTALPSDIMHTLGYEPATVVRKQWLSVQYPCGFQVRFSGAFYKQCHWEVSNTHNKEILLRHKRTTILAFLWQLTSYENHHSDFALCYILSYNDDILNTRLEFFCEQNLNTICCWSELMQTGMQSVRDSCNNACTFRDFIEPM